MTTESRKSPAGNQGPSTHHDHHHEIPSSLVEKTCARCGESKPLDEFHRNKQMRDGRINQCKACRAEYRCANRERLDEYHREYREANRDRINEYDREYHYSNPHISWEGRYRRRAHRYGITPVVESFTRDDLIAKYGDACVHCGGPFEQLDHYPVPVAHGGVHSLDNCVPSCAPCNLAQGPMVRRLAPAGPAEWQSGGAL